MNFSIALLTRPILRTLTTDFGERLRLRLLLFVYRDNLLILRGIIRGYRNAPIVYLPAGFHLIYAGRGADFCISLYCIETNYA